MGRRAIACRVLCFVWRLPVHTSLCIWLLTINAGGDRRRFRIPEPLLDEEDDDVSLVGDAGVALGESNTNANLPPDKYQRS
jgi:hypothetical protein